LVRFHTGNRNLYGGMGLAEASTPDQPNPKHMNACVEVLFVAFQRRLVMIRADGADGGIKLHFPAVIFMKEVATAPLHCTLAYPSGGFPRPSIVRPGTAGYLRNCPSDRCDVQIWVAGGAHQFCDIPPPLAEPGGPKEEQEEEKEEGKGGGV